MDTGFCVHRTPAVSMAPHRPPRPQRNNGRQISPLRSQRPLRLVSVWPWSMDTVSMAVSIRPRETRPC
jgi:hypothetical protein